MNKNIIKNFKQILSLAQYAPYYNSIHEFIDTENIIINTINNLPFAFPADLSKKPISFIPVKKQKKIKIIATSSGISSNPKIIQLTGNDLRVANKKNYSIINHIIEKEDKVVLILPFGPHIGGVLANYLGFNVPCTHVSMFTPGAAIYLIQKLGFNVIASSIPIVLNFIKVCQEKGVDIQELGIKKILVGGVTLFNNTRKFIENTFNATIFDIYALAECGGFLAAEGDCHCGFHFPPSKYYYLEVIDKKGNHAEKGELVITCFKREGTQIIRYKTGDIVSLIEKQCGCGIKTPRIKLEGRVDDMVTVGYMNLFWDRKLSESIINMPIKDYRVEIEKSKNGSDILKLNIISEKYFNRNDFLEVIKKANEELYIQLENNLIRLEIIHLGNNDDKEVLFKINRRVIDNRKIK